tara:strand:+ start:44 stop:268 length:225 start_codon:yes stop_codon:yes gene_type:complete
MSKITKEEWKRELIYHQKSVAWIGPDGVKYSLWSKVPHQNKDGELIMVDNDKMADIYYSYMGESTPKLLKSHQN